VVFHHEELDQEEISDKT